MVSVDPPTPKLIWIVSGPLPHLRPADWDWQSLETADDALAMEARGLKVLRIDIDPTEMVRQRPDLGVVGDAAEIAAIAASINWSQHTDETRRQACRDMARVLREHTDEQARQLSHEEGKPRGGLGAVLSWAAARARAWPPMPMWTECCAKSTHWLWMVGLWRIWPASQCWRVMPPIWSSSCPDRQGPLNRRRDPCGVVGQAGFG